MRGAPPVELAFVLAGSALPPVLADALAEGALARDIGTNEAENMLKSWGIKIRTGRIK
jgi:hypothetical protein